MSTYLKITDLSLSFGNQKIFDKANLIIDKPGFYCLMGRNGCGKTTLFKAILNDVSYQEGLIEIIGDNSQVSYCMADPVVFENLSVYENLKLITDDDNKIKELSSIFGIETILNESAKKCSAGEKQRICLISAIIEDKPIILLDEATSHLDDFNSTKALDYIKELSKTHVVIYSTHYEYDAKKYADAYIKIEDCKIILDTISLNEGKVKTKEKFSYYPKKLFRKIVFWKPDYVFSILFAIMICLTMTFTWLLNITPTKVYKEYQTKSANPQYAVIDDEQSSPYNDTGYIYLENKNDEFIENLISKNNKVCKGLKSIRLYLTMENKIYIDYVVFDENLEDDKVLITSNLKKALKSEKIIISDRLIFNDVDFSYSVLDGNYFNNYFVSNQLTFKKLMKLNRMNTTKNSNVKLISGNFPTSDDEIAVDSNFNYDKENMTATIKRYNVSKTFKVTGIFNGKFSNITGNFIDYVLTESGYDFILNTDALDFSGYKIAYCNTYDLSLSDYDYIIDNNMVINNDVIRYSKSAYDYVKQLKIPLVIGMVFILTFDILITLFYLSYYKHANAEKYNLLKVLKKTQYVKKDVLLFKFILNVLVLGLSLGAFFITQGIINQNLIDGSIIYFALEDYEVAVTINYFFNSFSIYTIPVLIVIQSLICIKQLRRAVK